MNSLSFSASAKSENFVGRDFVFTAINNFLDRYPKGYFTIVGVPGSGKSAILAQLVLQNPDIIYYNAQIPGKNRVKEFLTDICSQLITKFQSLLNGENQDFDNYDSSVFSFLLQQISEHLSPNSKLIIIIDGLDAINLEHQAIGTNLFYLPRYLPNQVYFIFARRPYKKSHGGLLIEAPSQVLDLSDFQEENREDVKLYIQRNLTPLTPLPYKGMGEQEFSNSPLLAGEGLGERSQLIGENEDNFMYVQQVLAAFADGFYDQPENINSIPPDLDSYYQQHWEKMQGDGLSDVAVNLLRVLTAGEMQPISTLAISQEINVDVFDVMEVIEQWLEFMQEFRTGKETKYQLYHHGFRLWLRERL
ncbi:ATP-binding protein [Anabaena catenula]|uniref:ATP-binding protein n=1 Tax=Anabaena catenula FACHB-362 TaxID=2692877 RepID=A0ABR8J8G4_9NOST|nr:ATP-binding protein [Anabaena catenula]MBD2694139.1 ATP-binding protein [Anabaena catenula FACHB-362]